MIDSIYRYKLMHKNLSYIYKHASVQKNKQQFLTLQYKNQNSLTTLTKMCLLNKLHNIQKSPLQKSQ